MLIWHLDQLPLYQQFPPADFLPVFPSIWPYGPVREFPPHTGDGRAASVRFGLARLVFNWRGPTGAPGWSAPFPDTAARRHARRASSDRDRYHGARGREAVDHLEKHPANWGRGGCRDSFHEAGFQRASPTLTPRAPPGCPADCAPRGRTPRRSGGRALSDHGVFRHTPGPASGRGPPPAPPRPPWRSPPS